MEDSISNPSYSSYNFGPFVLDAAERTLYKDGQPVSLTRKVFDLLRILVASPGVLQSREVLIEALWPDNVVNEQNLAAKMYALRKALGDDGREPHYIETVRGVGYRFIAEVHLNPDCDEAGSITPGDKDASWRWGRTVLAAAFCVIAVTAALYLWPWMAPGNNGKHNHAASHTIAVLPFESLSTDPGNAYFASGIQDEILTQLSAIKDMKVISRTSSSRYPSHPGNLSEIVHELGVTYLLEGSVQKNGDDVLINVQLIDARSNAHIWAQSYHRTLKNVFRIETRVAQEVAHALQAEITDSEAVYLKPPTLVSSAYLDFLKANYLADKLFRRNSTLEPVRDFREAVALYRKAIARDPDFALAYVHLSRLESWAFYFGVDFTPGLIHQAKTDASEALRIEPGLPSGKIAMGYAYYWNDETEKALHEFETARESLPHDADLISALAGIHRRQGKWKKSNREFSTAISYDPRNPLPHYQIALNLTEMRLYSEAIKHLDIALALEPEDYTAMAYKIRTLILSGKTHQARELLHQESQKNDPQGYFSALRYEEAWFFGNPEKAFEALRNAPEWVHGAISFYRMPKMLLEARALALENKQEKARKYYHSIRKELEKFASEHPDYSLPWACLGLARAESGSKSKAIYAGIRGVRALPVSVDAYSGTEPLGTLARIYALTGEKTKAIALLRRLLGMPAGQTISVPLLRIEPTWDSLRSDPRFQALLREYAHASPSTTASAYQ